MTKCLTAGALFASGDILAQKFLEAPSANNKRSIQFDWSRLLSFSAFGCVVFAPSNHYWFAWMERSVATSSHYQARPMLQALLRVTLHSAIYAPCSIIFLFLWMGVTQGNRTFLSLQDSIAPQKVLPVWRAGAVFWIPTMLAIYRFVPLHVRVLATSAGNVFWTTYLSHKKAAVPIQESPLENCTPLEER